ncbi:hypothetical protein PAT3040_05888 [Paenibacillus agaridevorans]|uniref:Beta-glucosidase n=1 Tax=Paenibacillus agaridevorans TaxID=171404 RepID=A0A2R5EYB1_9BACL|nr:GH116 family glycosyl-hydrolase [Paenibacillus agaridevorans]GBG11105.1 hypothetical protein PAT3040_05888 [Paenibacillus agaridevorans]
MKQGFVYTGANTGEISFPLGGIGTGSIGLSGNGGLIDWQIRNRPAKFSLNGFSFFAVKAERDGRTVLAKVVQGDKQPPYSGEGRGRFEGYGFGPRRGQMAGFPHFRDSTFRGEFPIAELGFKEEGSPLAAKLTAFNPFIPMNERDSSLPVAIFVYEVENRSKDELDVSLAGCVSNPFAKGSVNVSFRDDAMKGVTLSTAAIPQTDPEYGEITLSTDAPDASLQTYWYRGEWFDNITVFWKEFLRPGRLPEREYAEPRDLDVYRVVEQNFDTCSVVGHRTLRPGERAEFRFVLAWHFPWAVNDWNPLPEGSTLEGKWKNYYATEFEGSRSAAAYAHANYGRLLRETMSFKEALFQSTLPEAVIEAVSANLSTLKSPTVMRLTDGSLYGFEGCHTDEGSCEGSCTHVWNYEQATAFLFPALARSMRSLDYAHNQYPNGKMAFRTMLPLGREKSDYHAAVDGQMGAIVRTYREWRLSGDTSWLRKLWPAVKKALAFAWASDNEHGWDRNRDGILEGAQHHTLDVELYGPNSYLNGYYQAALLAAACMARALGDGDADQYETMYRQGKSWIDANAFNGEYYHQLLDLSDSAYPVDPELGEIKYQIGQGCHIDQVIGQWHARVAGLGDIFDRSQVRSALASIYRYNFVSMREHANSNRVYALNDERGVLVCTWPRGGQPLVPVPYADECMTGFEYQAASHMIYEGLVDEGLSVVRAVRERYDGVRRNPWNEFECGSHYARAMSSYALLLAMSGFQFDMSDGEIAFSPATKERELFRSFWAAGNAWGSVEMVPGRLALQVLGGELRLKSIRSKRLEAVAEATVRFNEGGMECRVDGGRAILAEDVVVRAKESLIMNY